MSIKKTFNFASGSGKITLTLNAAKADAPAEILICEDIGKDPWTGDGISAKDIRDTLAEITPKNRPINFLVNSQGGIVSEGVAIRNILNEWDGPITKTIIGVAASTASWCIPADNVRAYKNSQVFVHRAMGMVCGNVDDIRKAIDYLEKTDNQIADMLANDSDGDPAAMLDLMKNETLLTGQEAKDLGMVDELIDGEATNQFPAEWLNAAKQKLAALNSYRISAPTQGAANQNQNPTIMNKTQMLALLNKWGVSVPENATDEQLIALVNAGPKPTEPKPAPVAAPAPAPINQAAPLASLEDHPAFKAMNAQLVANRRKEILSAVEKAAQEGKIPVLEIENWTNDAVSAADHPTTGNPVLARLSKLENRAPGVPQLSIESSKLEVTNAAFSDIVRGFKSHNEASESFMRGNDSVTMKEIAARSVEKANFFKKFRNRFMEMANTNTIDAGLQRQVILQDVVIRDFARRVLPLSMFSTVFRNVPLQGLNTVEVPYYDLDSSASTAFVSGTGYTTTSNTTSAKREITVGEGAVGSGHSRLYQAVAFSSQEIARQPYLKVAELAGLKAEKLAFDIWQDVLSCITAANFGAAAITKAAASFDSDQLALLKLACKAWPQEGRGLILDSAYDANLLQDPSFKFALNAASDSAIKEGRLFPRVFGFDYTENPNIPTNAWNLVGFAVWKYAILVAFAPVPPVQEVRNSGTTWELVTDPATGISLEYRQFGNNVTDSATNVIESSYGYAPGLKTALKAIVSA